MSEPIFKYPMHETKRSLRTTLSTHRIIRINKWSLFELLKKKERKDSLQQKTVCALFEKCVELQETQRDLCPQDIHASFLDCFCSQQTFQLVYTILSATLIII